jgi:hypothetical protein
MKELSMVAVCILAMFGWRSVLLDLFVKLEKKKWFIFLVENYFPFLLIGFGIVTIGGYIIIFYVLFGSF